MQKVDRKVAQGGSSSDEIRGMSRASRKITAISGFGPVHSDFALDVQDILFRCVIV